MLNKKIIANLVAFSLLFVFLSVWAVQNVITFDFIERPYQIKGEFASSPGLQKDFEVTYLGLRVGKIGSVKLEGGRVLVTMDIQREVNLPANPTAAIGRKSAVGEPYIALSPPAGYTGGGPYIDHHKGELIPMDRTSIPLSYGELFKTLDQLVSAIPGDSLNTLVHELATALKGRGQSLRTIVESAEDLSSTLVAHSDLLDQMTTDFTRLTHTFTTKRDAAASTLDNLSLLTQTLAGSTADIARLIDESPDLATRVSKILEEAGGQVGCALDSLANVSSLLAAPNHLDDLAALLDSAAFLGFTLRDSRIDPPEEGVAGPWINGPSDLGAVPLVDYAPRPELPQPPTVATCTERLATPGAGGNNGINPGEAPAVPSGGASPADSTGRPPAAQPVYPASTEKPAADKTFNVGLVLYPFLATLLVLVLIATQPWKQLAAARHRNKETQ